MLDRLLVIVVGSLVLAAISVQLLLLSLPLLRRIEFDAVCHQYALLIDQNGGLSQEAAADLTAELAERRFTVSSIQAPRQGLLGEMMEFSVSAEFSDRRLTPVLQMEEISSCFVYKTNIFCRVLPKAGVGQ